MYGVCASESCNPKYPKKYNGMNDVIHKILEFTIGNVFGRDITCREPVHRCDEYQPGSLIELGRTGIKV